MNKKLGSQSKPSASMVKKKTVTLTRKSSEKKLQSKPAHILAHHNDQAPAESFTVGDFGIANKSILQSQNSGAQAMQMGRLSAGKTTTKHQLSQALTDGKIHYAPEYATQTPTAYSAQKKSTSNFRQSNASTGHQQVTKAGQVPLQSQQQLSSTKQLRLMTNNFTTAGSPDMPNSKPLASTKNGKSILIGNGTVSSASVLVPSCSTPSHQSPFAPATTSTKKGKKASQDTANLKHQDLQLIAAKKKKYSASITGPMVSKIEQILEGKQQKLKANNQQTASTQSINIVVTQQLAGAATKSTKSKAKIPLAANQKSDTALTLQTRVHASSFSQHVKNVDSHDGRIIVHDRKRTVNVAKEPIYTDQIEMKESNACMLTPSQTGLAAIVASSQNIQIGNLHLKDTPSSVKNKKHLSKSKVNAQSNAIIGQPAIYKSKVVPLPEKNKNNRTYSLEFQPNQDYLSPQDKYQKKQARQKMLEDILSPTAVPGLSGSDSMPFDIAVESMQDPEGHTFESIAAMKPHNHVISEKSDKGRAAGSKEKQLFKQTGSRPLEQKLLSMDSTTPTDLSATNTGGERKQENGAQTPAMGGSRRQSIQRIGQRKSSSLVRQNQRDSSRTKFYTLDQTGVDPALGSHNSNHANVNSLTSKQSPSKTTNSKIKQKAAKNLKIMSQSGAKIDLRGNSTSTMTGFASTINKQKKHFEVGSNLTNSAQKQQMPVHPIYAAHRMSLQQNEQQVATAQPQAQQKVGKQRSSKATNSNQSQSTAFYSGSANAQRGTQSTKNNNKMATGHHTRAHSKDSAQSLATIKEPQTATQTHKQRLALSLTGNYNSGLASQIIIPSNSIKKFTGSLVSSSGSASQMIPSDSEKAVQLPKNSERTSNILQQTPNSFFSNSIIVGGTSNTKGSFCEKPPHSSNQSIQVVSVNKVLKKSKDSDSNRVVRVSQPNNQALFSRLSTGSKGGYLHGASSSLLEPSRPTSTQLNNNQDQQFGARKSSVQIKGGSFIGSYNPPESLTHHKRMDSESSIFLPKKKLPGTNKMGSQAQSPGTLHQGHGPGSLIANSNQMRPANSVLEHGYQTVTKKQSSQNLPGIETVPTASNMTSLRSPSNTSQTNRPQKIDASDKQTKKPRFASSLVSTSNNVSSMQLGIASGLDTPVDKQKTQNFHIFLQTQNRKITTASKGKDSGTTQSAAKNLLAAQYSASKAGGSASTKSNSVLVPSKESAIKSKQILFGINNNPVPQQQHQGATPVKRSRLFGNQSGASAEESAAIYTSARGNKRSFAESSQESGSQNKPSNIQSKKNSTTSQSKPPLLSPIKPNSNSLQGKVTMQNSGIAPGSKKQSNVTLLDQEKVAQFKNNKDSYAQLFSNANCQGGGTGSGNTSRASISTSNKSERLMVIQQKAIKKMPQPQVMNKNPLAQADGGSEQTKEVQQNALPPPLESQQLNVIEERIETQDSAASSLDPNLSPRSRIINKIQKKIKLSFMQTGSSPETQCEYYKIGKVMGKGAFGKVNLAIHRLSNKFVALKSINKEFLHEESSKRKVMQEFNILRRTRHCNIVRLYESFETQQHIVFVMEVCGGGDLLTYVRRRRKLKEEVARFLFNQIITAVRYCHSKNVLHRDIKLDNILLTSQGEVKICDFGVSKLAKNGEIMTEQCGTPAYIAPEVFQNKGYEGYASDVWSAGVVLYAMLYGAVPFKASNMTELHKQVVKCKPVFKDEISSSALTLLKGILEKDPKKRLSPTQILEHPWMMDTNEKRSKAVAVFTDHEKQTIVSEFEYYNVKKERESGLGGNQESLQLPTDPFAEQMLSTTQNSDLKNVSTRSVILAPFNSTRSNLDKDAATGDFIDKSMMVPKRVIKFSAKVKEVDRQYEMNNNAELDNGVYHQEDEEGTEENKMNISHSMHTRDNGRMTSLAADQSSLATSFNQQQLQSQLGELEEQSNAQIVAELDEERTANKKSEWRKLEKMMLNSPKKVSQHKDIIKVEEGKEAAADDLSFEEVKGQLFNDDEEPVARYGGAKGKSGKDSKAAQSKALLSSTLQSGQTLSGQGATLMLDEKIVADVERSGYPKQYIIQSLNNDELNHATTYYYLVTTEVEY